MFQHLIPSCDYDLGDEQVLDSRRGVPFLLRDLNDGENRSRCPALFGGRGPDLFAGMVRQSWLQRQVRRS